MSTKCYPQRRTSTASSSCIEGRKRVLFAFLSLLLCVFPVVVQCGNININTTSRTDTGTGTGTGTGSIQIVETEYWNGRVWVGAPHRWTTPLGAACASPADMGSQGWKIVLGGARDDYGWNYYYTDPLNVPKRLRIWLRVQIQAQAQAQGRTVAVGTPPRPSILQNMRDDWNFKGFGLSFYKSLIWLHSCGFSFRIPLTSNFGIFDRHPEWPKLSMSLSFYYPFTASLSLSCSVNLEYVRYVALQACIAFRHVIAMMLLWFARGLVLAGSTLAFPITQHWYEVRQPHLLLPDLQQTQTLTPKPTFSSTLQERVGVSYSWRYSASRGYYTRRSVSHLYLPTILSLLELIDACQQKGQTLWHKYRNRYRYYRDYYQTRSRNYWPGFVPFAVKNRQQLQQPIAFDDLNYHNNNKFRPLSLFEHISRDTGWADWLLQRKTGSLGVSSSYPSSDKPYFSCSAALSLSGFDFKPDTIRKEDRGFAIHDEQGPELSTMSSTSELEDNLALPAVKNTVKLSTSATTATAPSTSASKKTTATA
jgi:hypothetical protein